MTLEHKITLKIIKILKPHLISIHIPMAEWYKIEAYINQFKREQENKSYIRGFKKATTIYNKVIKEWQEKAIKEINEIQQIKNYDNK